ncbi:MAG: NADH-quinone oxidoreductase subunit K [Pseudohongiella sp.]|nr:NADH-quinone oxidoreductase subunit K [Pseudohongiella sp.]
MSAMQLYTIVGAAIFLLALHGLLMTTDSIRRLIAVNLMGAGTFLIMIALAARISPPDPVLHALVVTGLVVAISATALALRLITSAAIAQHSQDSENKGDGDLSEDVKP